MNRRIPWINALLLLLGAAVIVGIFVVQDKGMPGLSQTMEGGR